jgi:hypothetical protein
MIEGWTCRLVRGQRSAVNYDTCEGAWLMPDGRLCAKNESGDDTAETNIPPAVLAWLVAPLLLAAKEPK